MATKTSSRNCSSNARFSCEACGKSFKAMSDLQKHNGRYRRNVSTPGVCACAACGAKLCSMRQLPRHLRSHHRVVLPQSAKIEPADLGLPTQEEEPRKFGVAKNFAPDNLTRVMPNTNFCGRKFRCHLCEWRFLKLNHLKTHIAAVHEKIAAFKCEFCGAPHSTKLMHELHSRTHTESYICCQCGRTFSSKRALRVHCIAMYGRYHMPRNSNVLLDQLASSKPSSSALKAEVKFDAKSVFMPRFHCSHCNRSMETRAALHRHVLQVHLDMRRYSCSLCDRKFKEMNHLREHIASVHTKPPGCSVRAPNGPVRYGCAICGFYWRDSQKLVSHLQHVHNGFWRSHPERFEFNCARCSKGFGCSSALNLHLKHHKNGRVRCGVLNCRLRFPRILELAEHVLSAHAYKEGNGKLYKCSHCLLSFGFAAGLIEHLSYHCNFLPFVCSACNAGFRRRLELFSHARTVHCTNKIRSMPCMLCKATCSCGTIHNHIAWHFGASKGT